jgi:hypothetical protein
MTPDKLKSGIKNIGAVKSKEMGFNGNQFGLACYTHNS